jgi:hypothetical protein
MRKKKDKGLLTVKSFEGKTNELKRAKYILAFLQTGSIAYASKVSGLSGKAHSRIVEMFSQRGHALDRHRSGRPVVYSDSQMTSAIDLLAAPEEGLLSGNQAHNKLVSAGSLHSSSAVQPFMQHLRKYVKGQGHQLITNSVKTTFFVHHEDKAERVTYARTMLDNLERKGALGGLIFVDETTLEAVPHPKGTVKGGMMIKVQPVPWDS